jgi:hypothetical protein
LRRVLQEEKGDIDAAAQRAGVSAAQLRKSIN